MTNSTEMDNLSDQMIADITCVVVMLTLVIIVICFGCVFVRIAQDMDVIEVIPLGQLSQQIRANNSVNQIASNRF